MLLYTHLVWTLNLEAFLGPHAWLTRDTVALMNQTPDGRIYAWSYLAWTDSPAVIWPLHIAALVVLAMLTVGLFTRVTSVLALVITLSYCHRLTGSLFGLDQVNAFIAMYLMVGPAGAVWSVDRWLASRRLPVSQQPGRRGLAPPPATAVTTNIAIRLLATAHVRDLSVRRHQQDAGQRVVGRQRPVVWLCEPGVSVDRHDLDGARPLALGPAHAHHGVLGNVLLRC